MTYPIDETHNPELRSWVESANDPNTDFPIQNLPFGVFRRAKSSDAPRVGVAIGDRILDLTVCVQRGLFGHEARAAANACCSPSLNLLMALGRTHWSDLRHRISNILRVDSQENFKQKDLLSSVLVPMDDAAMFVPAHVGDYTDFYASLYHATNVGSMFRPDNPLLPNYKYIPIGYHGRSSSIVVSLTSVTRPSGQTKEDDRPGPTFGPSKFLDYELEV